MNDTRRRLIWQGLVSVTLLAIAATSWSQTDSAKQPADAVAENVDDLVVGPDSAAGEENDYAAEADDLATDRDDSSRGVDAIASAKSDGLTPETLMVFGHHGVDTENSLIKAVEFTQAMWDQYGSLPRPHVAKSVVPGNDGWRDLAFFQTLSIQKWF